MTNPRTTRSAAKSSGIADTFLAITRPEQASSSGQPQGSPSAVSIHEGDDGNNQDDNFLPVDRTDPDDPDDPDDNEPDEPAAQPDQSLARSLALLANKIGSISEQPKSKSKVKQRAPDVFDGTDASKLDTFVFQCSMYISACKSDFPDQESRVSFALSYLKGVPLDWFQGEVARALDDGEYPNWFTAYAIFISELRRLFGPRDPVADATNAIEALKYKDSTKATRYTIDFNRHAHRTGWNDMALTRQYYKGLPDRLKDEIARVGKPVTLQTLQDLVATLDQRHWERQAEISRDKRSASNNPISQNKSTSSDNRNDNRSGNQNASGSKTNAQNNNNNNNQQSKNKDQKKSSASTNTSNPGNKTNNISDLLGPDGKLKPEERQRRMDNNLCLRCGKPGHTVNNCPVTSKAKPKGRAATVATPSTATPAATASGKA